MSKDNVVEAMFLPFDSQEDHWSDSMCLKEKDSQICNSQMKREFRSGDEGGNTRTWFIMQQELFL